MLRMCLATRTTMRSIHLAISALVIAACESPSVRETECARIRELTEPKRTWSYSKPVPLSAMDWKDPEIRAAVARLERGTSECVDPQLESSVGDSAEWC